MIVYGSSLSPFVRKVLVIAAEKRIEVENRVAGPGAPPPEGFLEASPFKKIPAIRDGDFTLSDSTAIAMYLEAVRPEPALFPSDPQARGRAVWFDEFADTIVSASGAKMFFNRVVAKLIGAPCDSAVADAAEREEFPALLDYLEGVLAEGGGYLVADSFSIADVAIGSVFVNYAHSKGKMEVDRHPKLVAYLHRVHSRPSFAKIIASESGFLTRAFGA